MPTTKTDKIEQTALRIREILDRAGATLGDPDFEERLLDAMVDAEVDVDDPDERAAHEACVRALLAEAPPQARPRGARRPPAGSFGAARRASGTLSSDSSARKPPNPADLSAPYRFVVLNDKVAAADPQIEDRGLDLPLPGGFCGSIAVEWAFETPLLIGARRGSEEVDRPLRLGENGPYVIPGATLRGLLRSTCEILAYGRLFQVNRHHRYGVRDFGHELFSDAYRPSWKTLGAGWLRRSPASEAERERGLSDYLLEPCDKYQLRIRALRPVLAPAAKDGEFHLKWLGMELEDRYAAAGQHDPADPRRYDFSGRGTRCRFAHDADPDYLVPTADPQGIAGVLVAAGKSPTLKTLTAATLDRQAALPDKGDQKKREYVFVDRPGATAIRIATEAFQRFELAHSKPSKNKREPEGSYEVLHPTLAAGGRIPVFYIGNPDPGRRDADFSIGLTRLFKRSHRYSVGQVLKREAGHALAVSPRFKPDAVEALFGYVFEPDEIGKSPAESIAPGELARKGRVACGFARLVGEGTEAPEKRTVMMGPRASYGPFYLRGVYKDWTAPDARLAGRKRYFPRFAPQNVASPEKRRESARALYQTLDRKGDAPESATSHLRYLEPAAPGGELVFSGEIRLHNVSAAEVGMLLWALSHGGDPAKPYRHMVGRGKAAGAGQARVRAIRLALIGNDATADKSLADPDAWELPGPGREGWAAPGGQSLAPFLRAFEAAMRRVEPGWPMVDPVLELLGVAKPALGAAIVAAKRGEYLPLPHFKALRDAAKLGKGRTVGDDRFLAAPKLAPGELTLPYRT